MGKTPGRRQSKKARALGKPAGQPTKRIAQVLASLEPNWDVLSCAYGAHAWAFNDPCPGMKRCVGTCGGTYQMADWEREEFPAPKEVLHE